MDTMSVAFFRGLIDDLEKDAADMVCDTPGKRIRSKGKGKGLARGKGKGPMGMPTKKVGRRDMGKEAGHASNYLYEKVTGKKKKKLFGKGGLIHDTDEKKGSSIKAKIEEARKDPSTKANPKDTGPKGSGTQDPRFKAQKGRGFGKKAWLFSSESGKARALELKKHIDRHGGDINKGVASYNAAKKKEREKGMGKKAEEAFFAGFDKEAIEGTPIGRYYEKGGREQKARDLMARALKGRRPGGSHPQAGKAFAKKSLERYRAMARKAGYPLPEGQSTWKKRGRGFGNR